MTYSINNGTPTEAFGWNNINTVLSELPDNTTNLIDPHDLRDLAYTVWQSVALKPTTNTSNIEYIGVDQTNLYEKMLLGKKQVSGIDVLTLGLLNSDVDHFFYNTKTDTDLNSQNTRVAFLAGSSASIFFYGNTVSVPYIGSRIVTNLYGNVLNFDIINNSYLTNGGTSYGGSINILSNYGNVLVNGLVFPTYAQNIPGAVTDNSVLVYKNIGGNAYLQWAANSPVITSITSSGTFSINASKVIINGFDTVFTDSRPTTVSIGSVVAGSTFSNIPIIEMLRMILYAYVPPRLTLISSSNFIEVNTFGSVGLTYSITKVMATFSITSINSTPIFLSGTSSALTYLNATASINRNYTAGVTYSSGSYFTTPGVKGFTLSVSDIIGTVSTSCNVTAVYPTFYGTSLTFSSIQSVVQGLLNSFTKVVDNNISRTVPISGTGVCIYYCVPNIYNVGGTISSLYDTSNPLVNINGNFRSPGSAFTMSLSSPSGYWGSTVYNCYIYSPTGTASTTSVGVYPFYATNYQFNF